jgi:multidrug resistance protein, MATE family
MSGNFRKDLAEVLSTAWPLMLATGLFSITLFVDRLLLYRYSDAAASAALGAGTILWSINCLPMGICGYTSTFVSQYLGVHRPQRAMKVVWQGVLLSFLFGPLLLLIGVFAEPFFLSIGHEARLAKQEAQYLIWLIPGTWATIITSALIGMYSGSGRTMILLYTDVVVTIVNGCLDYVLIFGHFGFPELGVTGAAIASSIALILKLVILAWVAKSYFQNKRVLTLIGSSEEANPVRFVSKADAVSEAGVDKNALVFDWQLMKRLVRFGWPAGVSVVAEAWSFTIIMMLVGRLGEQAAAATTLALNVNLIAFIPLIGLGIAIGVLVGRYVVQENIAKAKRIVMSGLTIGIAYSLVFVVLYGGFPDVIMLIYSWDVAPERFDAMRPMLRPLLLFIASYCVFDAFQTVFVGALKGAGDTMFVLAGHLFAGSVAVVGGIIGAWVFKLDGLYYWWWVITLWVMLLAVIFTLRYLQGGWQNKRVIEPVVVDLS